MKRYIEPMTEEVLLMSDAVMKITGPNSTPQEVAAGGEESSLSGIYDAPGNKRLEL